MQTPLAAPCHSPKPALISAYHAMASVLSLELRPETCLCSYTVGDGTTAGTSAVMNFTSAPVVGTLGFRCVPCASLDMQLQQTADGAV